MGSRSSADTLAAIFVAFREHGTWSQADLAERIGVSVKTVRARLDELSAHGFPLVSEHDHPHVYWSVPRGWFPGGLLIAEQEVPELLRLLARSAPSPFRDRLYRRVLESSPQGRELAELAQRVVTGDPVPAEQRFLPVVEDAIARRVALRLRYFSAHRGALDWRHVSALEEVRGPALRFIARCHRDDRLKWFRVDNIADAKLDPGEPYRPTPPEDVEAFRMASAEGFHTGDAPLRCTVFVRDPESRWAARNTPCPMTEQACPGGVLLRAETSGVPRLAAWVVSLGAAARAETPGLRELVRALAAGALGASGGGEQSVEASARGDK